MDIKIGPNGHENSSNEQKIVQMRKKYFKWEKNISNEKKIFQRIKIVKMNKNN